MPSFSRTIEMLSQCENPLQQKAIIFTGLLGSFREVLLNYTNIIKRIDTLLELVRNVNPSFSLGFPDITRIKVTPIM